MYRPAWLLGMTVVCNACERTRMLHELPELEVRVSVAHPVDETSAVDARPHVIVDLDYSIETFRRDHDAECAVLEDIAGAYPTLADEHATSAMFDDALMDMTDPGGSDDEGGCRLPRFEVDWTPSRNTEIELYIGDEQDLVTVRMYRYLITPRHATLRSHDTWSFAAGDVVTLDWSHAGDTGQDFEVWLEGALRAPLAPVTPNGTELTFQIPSPAPVTGTMLVNVIGGSFTQSGSTGDCTGAQSCHWTVPAGYRHQATVD
jgi:hypothetical protein